MKKTIRLSESDLHRVIRESVNRVLREDKSEEQLQEVIPLLKQADSLVRKAMQKLRERYRCWP